MSDKIRSYHVYQEFSRRMFVGAERGGKTIAAAVEEIGTQYAH